jgi:malonate transporter and related proteins
MIGTIEPLAQAGSPAALIALGINLFRFEVKGEKLGIVVVCALKLLAMPALAFLLTKLLPPGSRLAGLPFDLSQMSLLDFSAMLGP